MRKNQPQSRYLEYTHRGLGQSLLNDKFEAILQGYPYMFIVMPDKSLSFFASRSKIIKEYQIDKIFQRSNEDSIFFISADNGKLRGVFFAPSEFILAKS